MSRLFDNPSGVVPVADAPGETDDGTDDRADTGDAVLNGCGPVVDTAADCSTETVDAAKIRIA